MLQDGLGFRTGMPGQQLITWGERLAVPDLFAWTYILALCTVPVSSCFFGDPVTARKGLLVTSLVMCQFALAFRISGVPIYLALLHPVLGPAWWLLAMHSAVASITGRARWKGRSMVDRRLRLI